MFKWLKMLAAALCGIALDYNVINMPDHGLVIDLHVIGAFFYGILFLFFAISSILTEE